MYLLSTKKWFFTATNLNWINLIEDDVFKEIIVDALAYYSNIKRCQIHAFVIMPNHIHLLMTINRQEISIFQKDFLSFTAHKSIEIMKYHYKDLLNQIKSTQIDRKLHFWERRPLWVEIHSQFKLNEKLKYIHLNPVNSSKVICERPELYKWSSAASYHHNCLYYDFLTLIL